MKALIAFTAVTGLCIGIGTALGLTLAIAYRVFLFLTP